MKHVATLGLCEIRFLNRVIRWIVPPFGQAPERIEIEADPTHRIIDQRLRFAIKQEMHPFAIGVVSQADHVLQRLKLCRMSAEKEEHEFLEDLSRETFF